MIYQFLKSSCLLLFGQFLLLVNNPLFKMDNVILTPHNAALTKEATMRMAVHAAQGIDEVLTGKAPTWPVNKLK